MIGCQKTLHFGGSLLPSGKNQSLAALRVLELSDQLTAYATELIATEVIYLRAPAKPEVIAELIGLLITASDAKASRLPFPSRQSQRRLGRCAYRRRTQEN